MSTHRILLLGAGGHAEVVADILQQLPNVEIVGVLTPHPTAPGAGSAPRLGADEELAAIVAREHISGAIAAVGDNWLRQTLYRHILAAGVAPFSAIHPSAIISRSASLGRGLVVLPNVVINAHGRIGDNVILNTAATVDHHATIGDHVHIAPGCHLAGSVTVGDLTLIGIGAAVTPGVRIGARVLVGAGVTVTRDVGDDVRLTRA